jgi:hypothetical protein
MSTATELEPCVVVQRIGPIDHDGPGSVSAPGEGHCHPDAFTAVDNLFLGASYVRTGSGIDSMYSAKEAGMRAAQGVLTASHSPTPVPRIFEHFSLPRPIKWLWRPDDSTYAKGQRDVFDIRGS